jgi:hypothetical protein
VNSALLMTGAPGKFPAGVTATDDVDDAAP